jgi:hypothetical protein
MGTQSRMRQPRKTLLHLESFERRDLPAAIHHLLNPLLSAPVAVVVDSHVSVTHTDHLKISKSHDESVADTAQAKGKGDASADETNTASVDVAVTVNSSAGVDSAASADATLDASATVSPQTSVASVDLQTTEAVRATPSNPTDGSDQGTGGQSQSATSGADQGTTGSANNGSTVGGTSSTAAGAQGSSSGTSIPTPDNGSTDGVQAKVSAGQTSSDKQAETRSGNSGGATQATQVAPQTGDHAGLASGGQVGSPAGSTYSSSDTSSRVGAVDTAIRASTAVRSTASDGRHLAVGDSNLLSSQDTTRGRADDGSNTNHAPAGITALIGKGQAAENTANSDQVGAGASSHVRLDEGSLAFDARSILAANARRASSAETLLTDVIIGARIALPAENSQAANQDGTAEVDGSTLSADPLANLDPVSSSFLLDLESLTQEAERLVAGVEQAGQDLAGLLGRMHPLQSAIAVGVAATAISAAHRRLKQNPRGVAFACQPSLGGPLIWPES